MNPETKSKIKHALLGLVLAPFIATAFCFAIPLYEKARVALTGFDADQWQNDYHEKQIDTPRELMVDDVEEWLEAEKPCEEEILAKLGPPDQEGRTNVLRYGIGWRGSTGSDFVVLDIHLHDGCYMLSSREQY